MLDVGDGATFLLLAELPEPGQLSPSKIAVLGGLRSFNRDTGIMKRLRRIERGIAPIRTMLYMAKLSAIQCNLVMKRFYKKLVEQGKHKKVALTACMRKIMTILNVMVRYREHRFNRGHAMAVNHFAKVAIHPGFHPFRWNAP